MDYILNWSDGIGRVSAGNYLYDIIGKPVVGFEFDALYYETPTSIAIKILNGEQSVLTETEQVKCRQYCDTFKNSDDYKVLAIDPELKIFKGLMSRGECKEHGYEEVPESFGLELPHYPLVKLVDGKWERVVACITEKGKLALLPAYDDPAYNFFFTEKEWEAQPKPSYIYEEYNFATHAWEDARKIDSSKTRARIIVQNLKNKELDEFNLTTDMNDPVLYIVQAIEAFNYKDNNNADTPFIDSVVDNVQDETRESFISKVLSHYDPEYLRKLGSIHGKYRQLLNNIDKCTTMDELDSIMDNIESDKHTNWKIPATVNPYALTN